MPPVKRIRTLAVVLVALTSLTACGGEDGTTEAAPPVVASTAASASAPEPGASATTALPEAGSRGAVDAAKLCEQADAAKKKLVTLLAEAFSGTEPDPGEVQKVMADLGKDLTAIGANGGTSEAAAAMKEYGTELPKSAAYEDPSEAPNAAAAEKAGEKVDAICAKA